MGTWPVPNWISHYSYKVAPRKFGSRREGGKRKHAGCDICAPAGSSEVAIYPGRVIAVYDFYAGTDAVEIDHGHFGIIRYGEIEASVDGGDLVREGQVIGAVGTLVGLHVHPMLHIELYSGTATGKLTRHKGQYRRRSDLVDPTLLLDSVATH